MSIYYATFLLYGVLVIGCYKSVLECSIAFEIGLDAILTANVLDAPVETLRVLYNYVSLGFVVFIVVFVIGLVVGLVLMDVLVFHPMQCRFWVHLVWLAGRQ